MYASTYACVDVTCIMARPADLPTCIHVHTCAYKCIHAYIHAYMYMHHAWPAGLPTSPATPRRIAYIYTWHTCTHASCVACRFTDVTGYTKEDCYGRNCRFLQGPATNPEHGKMLLDTLRNGQDSQIMMVNYRKTGEVHTHACTRMHAYTRIHRSSRTCSRWRTYICMHVYACVCMYMHTYAYACRSSRTCSRWRISATATGDGATALAYSST